MTPVVQPYVRLGSPAPRRPDRAALHPVTEAVAGFGAVLMAIVTLPEGWSRPAAHGTFRCEQRTRRAGRSWASRGTAVLPVLSRKGRTLILSLRSEPFLGPADSVVPPASPGRRVVARGVALCGGHRGFVTLQERGSLFGRRRPELVLEWPCQHTERRLFLTVQGARDDDLAEWLPALTQVRCH